MLATAKPACAGRNLGLPAGATAGAITTPRALTIRMGGDDLTNLAWLQKPGVLNSMCTALTGSPHRVSKAGSRAVRRASGRARGSEGRGDSRRKNSDKMVNVILNVRNRKYNGEDAQKPPLSFACMIFMAIESSPTKTLPVKEIYEWVMWKFPFYRAAGPGWKNSVRHNLSLNKCFKKVDRSSSKSKSPLSKGGLWTVDAEYRRSLLAALRRSPYHPYHSYFSPPLSPSSSSSSLDSLDPAERDAALTMCMISGSPDHSTTVTPGILHAIQHDHCYSRRPPPSALRPTTKRG